VWLVTGLGLALLFGPIRSSLAADRQFLHGHVPPVVARLQPLGRLPGTNCLNLAIGLPLRNQAELDELLRQLYDPASTNFHKYLTPAESATRFGPTEEDYQAVEDFVRGNGLVVTGTYSNHVVLDIQGRVADVERAFQVNLQIYRHPSEARDFFAPDTEPSLPANLRVTSIEGLSDYSLPRRATRRVKAAKVRPLSFNGSGPGQECLRPRHHADRRRPDGGAAGVFGLLSGGHHQLRKHRRGDYWNHQLCFFDERGGEQPHSRHRQQ
jgi:hypothetical protein